MVRCNTHANAIVGIHSSLQDDGHQQNLAVLAQGLEVVSTALPLQNVSSQAGSTIICRGTLHLHGL